MKLSFEKFLPLMQMHDETFSSLARVCGGSPSMFTDWRANRYTPKLDKFAKIAEHWGWSLDFLLAQIQDDHAPSGFFQSSVADPAEKESMSGKKYYFDDETAALAEAICKDSNLRALFDAARGTKPEEMKLAADMLARFKENANG